VAYTFSLYVSARKMLPLRVLQQVTWKLFANWGTGSRLDTG